jgi:hypothetical protein
MVMNTEDQKLATGWLYQAGGIYSNARSVLEAADTLLCGQFHNDEPTRYNYGYDNEKHYKVTITVEEM